MDNSYFLYVRKSTDVEDKQVLSINAQLNELRSLAKRDGLNVVAEFVEKKSAKKPGRQIFSDMLRRVEKGEAQGIVCWKIDRLARNPVDGGQISWLLQQGVIQHMQTHDRSYLPGDNVLMMSVEFGMANQYIRDLSANTKRGLREKARRGDFPGPAPVSYLNNPRTKTVMLDRRKAPIIKSALELYVEGQSRLTDISYFLYDRGVKTGRRKGGQGGRRISDDHVKRILTDPFYYGHFSYGGDIWKGNHTPIISKALFDKVQDTIYFRGRGQKAKKDPQVFCGLLHCENCGCFITAEEITKYQKNGNIHRYVYYRCTKKRGPCSQSYVREEILTAQFSNLLSYYALPPEWARELSRMADKDELEAEHIAGISVQELKAKITDLNERESRLTDLYVSQDIDRDAYLERKQSLMSERKTAEEQIARLKHDFTFWLQPLREWINEGLKLNEIAQNTDLPSKKISLQKIFGSNLTLQSREARGVPKNPWLSLAVAKENSEKLDSSILLVL
ncbi:MAG: recombinase family protein [Patescibacteria group bacterium]